MSSPELIFYFRPTAPPGPGTFGARSGAFHPESRQLARDAKEEVLAETFLADSPSVAVTVHDGIVTLTGRTDTGQLARELVMAVRQIDGVVAVRGQLGYPGEAQ